jgi:hypothetical protein
LLTEGVLPVDLIMIAIGAVFFALSFVYINACEKL